MEIDKPGYQTLWRLTSQGIRPQEDWQARESDPREIDKPGYQTRWRLTSQGIRPQGDWHARVSDPREIDKPGYQTPGRLTHQSPIYELKIKKIGEFLINKNKKYFNQFVRGPGGSELWNIYRSKISLDCPFNEFYNAKTFVFPSTRIYPTKQ